MISVDIVEVDDDDVDSKNVPTHNEDLQAKID